MCMLHVSVLLIGEWLGCMALWKNAVVICKIANKIDEDVLSLLLTRLILSWWSQKGQIYGYAKELIGMKGVNRRQNDTNAFIDFLLCIALTSPSACVLGHELLRNPSNCTRDFTWWIVPLGGCSHSVQSIVSLRECTPSWRKVHSCGHSFWALHSLSFLPFHLMVCPPLTEAEESLYRLPGWLCWFNLPTCII